MAPKDLKKWLILLAILYLVFPRDLIPDFVGNGLGLLDDFLVMGLLANYLRRYTRNYMAGPELGGGPPLSVRRRPRKEGPRSVERRRGRARRP